MSEFFNWNDSWYVVSSNWLWVVIALGLGVWVGWTTNTAGEA